MLPCKNVSHIQVLSYSLFSNSTHKTKIGTANRTWETTKCNSTGPIKPSSQSETRQSRVDKYDFTLLIRLFQGFSRALEDNAMYFLQGS